MGCGGYFISTTEGLDSFIMKRGRERETERQREREREVPSMAFFTFDLL